MVDYKCFNCSRIIPSDTLRTRIRCVYCGSKILYKPRRVSVTVKAR